MSPPTEFILSSRQQKYAALFDDNKVNTGFTQTNRERGIRRLMAINILKRMESSVYSFRLTVARVRASIATVLDKIYRLHSTGSQMHRLNQVRI